MATYSIAVTDDIQIVAAANLEDMTTYVLLEHEDWFEPEIAFIRALLHPGVRAYDIGANHGIYALGMAARLSSTGHVWAFEPTAKPLAMLRQSIALNGFADRVTVMPVALSDHAGTARMGSSALSETNSLRHTGGETEEVRLETLDRVWADQGEPEIDFIKLDAEGEEENILAGGARFLTVNSPLIMFEAKSEAEHNLPLLEAFRARGYGLYRLLPEPGLLVPFVAGEALDTFQINLFACKPDRAARLEAEGLLASERIDPTALPPVDINSLTARPYARSWAADWGAADAGLACLLAAQERTRPPGARWGLLGQALLQTNAALADQPHPAVQMTRIRILRALGRYADALRCLRVLLEIPAADMVAGLRQRPFVPGLPAWEERAAVGGVETWCAALLADMQVRYAHFSTYFNQASWPAVWDARNNPDMTPAMRRSALLPLLRAGFGDRIPNGQEALLRVGPGHRNAAIWKSLLGAK